MDNKQLHKSKLPDFKTWLYRNHYEWKKSSSNKIAISVNVDDKWYSVYIRGEGDQYFVELGLVNLLEKFTTYSKEVSKTKRENKNKLREDLQ